MHRLEAVAHVRQRPSHDHAHGVTEVRLAHLVLEIDGQDFFREIWHRRRQPALSVTRGIRGVAASSPSVNAQFYHARGQAGPSVW